MGVRIEKGEREFLVHWRGIRQSDLYFLFFFSKISLSLGYSSKNDTWEPENNLSCPDLIKKFMAKQIAHL